MATATSPPPDERSSKRSKPGDDGSASQPPPEEGAPPGYGGRPPPMYHYPPGNGHPPHHPPPPGYMGGIPPYGGQYSGHWGGSHGPQGHVYPGSRPPPPHHMPPGGGPPPPDRQGWSHYRGHPPPPGRNGAKDDDSEGNYLKKTSPPPPQGAPPPPGYGPPGGWAHGQSWPHQGPYGPPPPGYGGPPPPHHSPAMYNQHPPYAGGAKSPPRPRGDLYGRRPPPSQQARPEMDISYLSTSGGMARPMMDNDGANSSTGGSDRDKGRGSYKCGRCGVPKKGHVCPYQPKLKRRPDQPPPETRHAAVQVEMDEFMTLRRLNIRIQGFPESYATEPYMMVEDMVAGEPRQVTNDSIMGSLPPGSITAIPHDGQMDDEMMNGSDRNGRGHSPRSSPAGSRPSSSNSRDMGVGDDRVDGEMEDEPGVAQV